MFDIWIGDVELTSLAILLGVVAVLPVQLLLCFRVRSRWIRLAPALLFTVLTALLLLLTYRAQDWDALGYLFFALTTGYALLLSGIGWGIWGLIRFFQKRRSSRDK